MTDQVNSKRKASKEAMILFRRQSWTTEGLHDAFVFVLKCEGDVEQIKAEIDETESLINDSFMLEGPMKPDAGPRIYKDGYLAGLRESLDIIASHAEPAAYQPEQRVEHVMAEKSEPPYHSGQTASETDEGGASASSESLTLRELRVGYQAMAADEAREAEALEGSEATIGDVADEAR